MEEEPAAIRLQTAPRGKPTLAETGGSLRFNLSHSGDVAMIAVVRELEVGVDIESIGPRRNLLALSRRALGEDEARRIEAVRPSDRLAAFHAAWVRREAIAKCHGVGLGAPLPDAPVSVSDLDVGPSYAAAIAVAGEEVPPLRRFVIEPDLASSPAG